MVVNKKFISLAGAVLLAAGLWTFPANAQVQRHWRGGGVFLLIRAAQLTPDQKTQVRTIMQASASTYKNIFSQLRPLRQNVNSQLFSTGNADPSLLSQISSLQNQLAQQRLSVFQQIWQLLTPAQQSQVATVYAQFQAANAQKQGIWQSLGQPQPPSP